MESSMTLNPIRAMKSLFSGDETMDQSIGFLPEIQKPSYPRQVVSGTGIDELYTRNNSDLLRLVDENKNL